jgi:hypothetical protein
VVFIAITKAEKFSKLLHSLVKRNHVPTSSSEEAFQTWRWGKWQEGHTEHPATEMSANDKSVKFQTRNPEILNSVPDRRRGLRLPIPVFARTESKRGKPGHYSKAGCNNASPNENASIAFV